MRLRTPKIPKQFRGAAIAEREQRQRDAENRRRQRRGLTRPFKR